GTCAGFAPPSPRDGRCPALVSAFAMPSRCGSTVGSRFECGDPAEYRQHQLAGGPLHLMHLEGPTRQNERTFLLALSADTVVPLSRDDGIVCGRHDGTYSAGDKA